MSNECLETSIGSFLTKINHIMSWGTTLGLKRLVITIATTLLFRPNQIMYVVSHLLNQT